MRRFAGQTFRGPSAAQSGAALVIAMVLMVVLSVLASGSMRSVTLQEKMSTATYDRALAFQAVEAALREAEALVAPGSAPVFPANGCSNGFCARPDSADEERWEDSSFNSWRNATVALGGQLAGAPRFIIEDMGTAARWFGCDRAVPVSPYCLAPRYRITASSSDTAGRASVILQVTYVPG